MMLKYPLTNNWTPSYGNVAETFYCHSILNRIKLLVHPLQLSLNFVALGKVVALPEIILQIVPDTESVILLNYERFPLSSFYKGIF